MKAKIRRLKIAIACLSAIVAGASALTSDAIAEARIVGTASVVDGDTLDLGAVRIRLNGIDAPEAGQTCQRANGQNWKCGADAADRLSDLVEGREVSCVSRDRDAYGRVVADCWQGEILVNATLVEEGLAWAFVRYSTDFVPQEQQAREARVGIWSGEAEPPWEYRENRWERAAEASPRPGCPIKGNINRQGERIYHTPWSPSYARTKINEVNGERWFCNEEEAIKAGWRAPRGR